MSTSSCSDCSNSSCPDCKAELYKRRWTKILVNWVNIHSPPGELIEDFTDAVLLDILYKYMDDICHDDLERALLCSDDIEPFMKYKYPILKLRTTWDDMEVIACKKYTLASVVLYHCCVNSKAGVVESKICQHLSTKEQELIVKFCENLGEMEVTINNVDSAITGAFETTTGVDFEKLEIKSLKKKVVAQVQSYSSLDSSSIETIKKYPQKKISKPIIKFKSSVSFMVESSKELLNDAGETETVSFTDDSAFNVFNFKEWEAKTVEDGERPTNRDTDIIKADDDKECHCAPAVEKSSEEADAEDKPAIKISSAPRFSWSRFSIIVGVFAVFIIFSMILFIILRTIWKSESFSGKPNMVKNKPVEIRKLRDDEISTILIPDNFWECKDNVCQKIYEPRPTVSRRYHKSQSRCVLLCTGPLLWPTPIGSTSFGKKIVALAKNKLEYKFESVPSDTVQEYLAEAFKLFLEDVTNLESIDLQMKNKSQDLPVKKLIIRIDVQSDADPRLRIDTEEAYVLKVESLADVIKVIITSPSFCGVRHGLETLSQLILLDQRTGYLIMLSSILIKDSPSYRYRGLMIDTARNYIPVTDLMRTIDTMSSCKLNTFHWRISDVASFPLLLPEYPQLFEYGGYDRNMVYKVKDVKSLVKRAGVRGIRVLIEVASPGPIGRAWSWSPDTTCVSSDANNSCHSDLCRRLKMTQAIFDVLEYIYTFIIKITHVDDIFHLSDGVFSFKQCFYILDDREGFLDKALARLRIANKGFLPKLPVIWYTSHLFKEYEGRAWERFGVQVSEWQANPSEHYLSKYKVIHSSRWELSCETRKHRCRKYRTWQEMYAWKSWRNLDVMTIEGGEATLWTDLVDSSNLDSHLWPRAAAVAERLWSDIIANQSAGSREYLRLDAHRWRMLLRGVRVPPVWPVWCSLNPKQCLDRLV